MNKPASGNTVKVICIQRILPFYAVPVFEKLAQRLSIDFSLYFGAPSGNIPKLKSTEKLDQVGFDYRKLLTISFRVRFRKRLFPVVFNPSLLWHLMRDRPDVLICEGESNLLNNIFIIPYCILTRTPYIWWGLGRVISRSESPIRKIFRPLITMMLRNAGAILAYSTHAKKFYVSEGASADSAFVAINSLDTTLIEESITRFNTQVDDQRRELGFDNMNIVLFVGALEPEKHIDRLLLAFQKIQKPDRVLLIVGDGSERAALERLAGQYELQNVVFTGARVDDISIFFLMADLFVLPGLGGLAIQQAMAHGLPVITVPADGTEADLVRNGENGYIVTDGDDIDIIASHMDHILSDKDLRDQMSRCSHDLVASSFNIKIMMDAVEEAIHHAVSDDS